MIYPKHSVSAGESIKEIHYGRKAIRNVYRKIDGVMKCVYSADLIYLGLCEAAASSQQLPIVRNWASVVACKEIPQQTLVIPGSGPYIHIYIPSSYDKQIRIYINGVMVSPQRIASRTYTYNLPDEMPRRTLYVCYKILAFSTAENTITFAAEPAHVDVSNPLLQLKTTDKTSVIAAINELYTLINPPSVS